MTSRRDPDLGGLSTASGSNDARTSDPTIVTLSLVSHTNVGKTTLARTLLRRDVGEVLDQAHVTEESEMHVLVRAEGAELRLWDTPGFGDSARLLRRLKVEDRPVLWFVQQLWDRVTDRPFWCGQQAVLNVRGEADVVLYLVNGLEDPESAGYVVPELDLLAWMERPLLVLLNQTGEEVLGRAERDRRLGEWRRFLARWPAVRDVLSLDAFCRTWMQEDVLMERLTALLEGEKAAAMRSLAAAWSRENEETFRRSVQLVASFLARAVEDRESTGSRRPTKEEKSAALEHLARRLEDATLELTRELLALHGLDGQDQPELTRALDAIVVHDADLLDEEKSAIWGGLVSGAVGGLAADLLAGGLTFGGGALAGAILGALGGAGLARGTRLVRGERRPMVAWNAVFLERLVVTAVVRYLAIASFGRGRGRFQGAGDSERWSRTAADELRRDAEEWRVLSSENAVDRERRMRRRLETSIRRILGRELESALEQEDVQPRASETESSR